MDKSLVIESYEDFLALEEHVNQLATEAAVSKQAADANLAMYLALEAIEKGKLAKTPENIANLANFSLGVAMEAVGSDPIASYTTLTLEELGREKKRFWERFKYHVAAHFKQIVDHYQAFWTLTQFQTNRIRKVRAELQRIRSSASATVTVPASKYMRYGNGLRIEDSDTYVKEFKKMTEVMTKMCAATSELNSASKFNMPAYLVDKLTWNGDEFVMDHFKILNDLVRSVMSSMNMKKVRTTETSDVVATDILLGLSQVVCRAPQKSLVKYGDYDTAVDLVGQIYMFVDRVQKFSTDTFSRKSDPLEFNKKQIDILVDQCDELLTESVKLLTLAKKYNAFIDDLMVKLWSATGSGGAAIGMSSVLYKDTRVDPQDVDLLPSIRIISRYMSMTFDCTSTSYNFSVGNVKKALSIAEEFIKRSS